MRSSDVRVDDAGVHLGASAVPGSVDVYFDDRRIWSFNVGDTRTPERSIRWPVSLRPFLNGVARVRLVAGADEIHAAHVQFGTGTERVRMLDKQGSPIVIDKWGLIQRPFEAQEPGVGAAMADRALEILDVIREGCGIEGWIAFGTLLGAVRDGHVIGHDSDLDLCYLSDQTTPAGVTRELWDIARALRTAGMRVQHRSASFVTVQAPTSDGSVGIDVYASFYVSDLFHATATVRAPAPRSAVLPLQELEFEGRLMPAPADPDLLLELSYGPGWRVPDPSFRYRTPPEVKARFEDWFSSFWHLKRNWIRFNLAALDAPTEHSAFATWVIGQLAPGTRVVEVGAGSGADLRRYAKSGFPARGIDFAFPAVKRVLQDVTNDATCTNVNLVDERAVLAQGAILARLGGDQVVCAREVLEHLDPQGVHGFWTMARLALRRGGRLYVEGCQRSGPAAARWATVHGVPRPRPLSLDDVVAQAGAAGGIVVHRENVTAADRTSGRGTPRWRIVVEWRPSVQAEGPPR